MAKVRGDLFKVNGLQSSTLEEIGDHFFAHGEGRSVLHFRQDDSDLESGGGGMVQGIREVNVRRTELAQTIGTRDLSITRSSKIWV